MKRKIYLILVCQLLAVWVSAQSIKAQKSTFIPNETNVLNTQLAAALNTKTGQTLVVWQRLTTTESVIQGRLVNAQGAPVGGVFPLSTAVGAAHPSAAYNPVRNEFMVAYDDNTNVSLRKSSVILRRLNAQGKPVAAEAKISTDTVSVDMANFFAKITFNPNTNAYTVVWLREISESAQADDGTDGMVGALVTSAGALGGPVALIQKTTIEGNRLWQPITLDLGYDPANGKLIVVFVQVISGTNASQANYSLATLDPALNGISASNIVKINNAPLQLTSGFVWGADLALFRDRPGFVFYTDSGNVKRRKIDLQGKLSGPGMVAFKPPKNNTKLVYPSVAFETNAKGTRGILIATQDAFRETGEASIWAQQLDLNCLPVGAPVRVDLTSVTNTALSSLLTPLPIKLTDSLFRFAAYYTLAEFKPPGQTFQNSGFVKLNINLTIP